MTTLSQVHIFIFAGLVLRSRQATTDVTATDKQESKMQTSSEPLFKHATSIFNIRSVKTATTITTSSENSTALGPLGINGKESCDSSTSSNDLPGGAIGGIVIGVLVLLCCCGAFGAKKSDHWGKALVWMQP